MSKHTLSLLFGLVLASTFAIGCGGTIDGGDDSLSEAALSAPEHSAYNYFVSKGLRNFQAAAVVGNLMQESNVNPNAIQYGGGPGRGIAQWSVGGRWDHDRGDNVATYAANNGESRWALNTQLGFTWFELANFSGYGLSSLRGSGSVSQATIDFQDRFEGCGACDQSNRIHYAEQVLAAYGSGGGGGGAGADCYSGTLKRQMPDNACVQSRFDNLWYQCANGAWVDRWTDPAACNGVHPL